LHVWSIAERQPNDLKDQSAKSKIEDGERKVVDDGVNLGYSGRRERVCPDGRFEAPIGAVPAVASEAGAPCCDKHTGTDQLQSR